MRNAFSLTPDRVIDHYIEIYSILKGNESIYGLFQ